MTIYRKLFDPRFISAEDLDGKEVTLTIAGIEKCKDIHNMQTMKEEEKPIIVFAELHRTGKLAGQPIKMVLNITNAKRIAEFYGKHFEQWSGKRITLFPTAIKAFKQTLDAIRIKKPSASSTPQPELIKPIEHPAGDISATTSISTPTSTDTAAEPVMFSDTSELELNKS